jgi:hypothetical protein
MYIASGRICTALKPNEGFSVYRQMNGRKSDNPGKAQASLSSGEMRVSFSVNHYSEWFIQQN